MCVPLPWRVSFLFLSIRVQNRGISSGGFSQYIMLAKDLIEVKKKKLILALGVLTWPVNIITSDDDGRETETLLVGHYIHLCRSLTGRVRVRRRQQRAILGGHNTVGLPIHFISRNVDKALDPPIRPDAIQENMGAQHIVLRKGEGIAK